VGQLEKIGHAEGGRTGDGQGQVGRDDVERPAVAAAADRDLAGPWAVDVEALVDHQLAGRQDDGRLL
jgi:hypothetical protein